MVLGIIVSLISLGLLIALMFNIAILALPLFAGVAAGRFVYETGAGALGVIVVGFLAGAAALGLAQVLLVMTRSTLVRLPIALAFAAPAALAGYHLVLGLTHIGGAYGVWEHFFAGVGAIAIGIAALKRLATPIIPPSPAAHSE